MFMMCLLGFCFIECCLTSFQHFLFLFQISSIPRFALIFQCSKIDNTFHVVYRGFNRLVAELSPNLLSGDRWSKNPCIKTFMSFILPDVDMVWSLSGNSINWYSSTVFRTSDNEYPAVTSIQQLSFNFPDEDGPNSNTSPLVKLDSNMVKLTLISFSDMSAVLGRYF